MERPLVLMVFQMIYLFIFAALRGLQELCSPTRERTWAHGNGSAGF